MGCWPVVLWGGREGRGHMDSGPHGRKGGQDMRKVPEPSACPEVPIRAPQGGDSEDSVFPEVGPNLRNTAKAGQGQVEGVRSSQKQAHQALSSLSRPSKGGRSQLYLTHCDPLLP